MKIPILLHKDLAAGKTTFEYEEIEESIFIDVMTEIFNKSQLTSA